MISDRFCANPQSADRLVAGFYLLTREHHRRVPLPVHVFFAAPVDPETLETLDRSPRWRLIIGGQELDEDPICVGGFYVRELGDIWPRCAANPITRSEYEYRMALASWAAENAPENPYADYAKRIDHRTTPLPPLPENVT